MKILLVHLVHCLLKYFLSSTPFISIFLPGMHHLLPTTSSPTTLQILQLKNFIEEHKSWRATSWNVQEQYCSFIHVYRNNNQQILICYINRNLERSGEVLTLIIILKDRIKYYDRQNASTNEHMILIPISIFFLVPVLRSNSLTKSCSVPALEGPFPIFQITRSYWSPLRWRSNSDCRNIQVQINL
jgi:hypothetical protein